MREVVTGLFLGWRGWMDATVRTSLAGGQDEIALVL
jgi:hypothetical protein